MRQNKWLVYGTLGFTIISLIVAVILGKNSGSIIYDISMAIFGSAFLGCIMSLIQYFSERRSAMEIFWKEASNALSELKKIPYIDEDFPMDLAAKCYHEEEIIKWKEKTGLLAGLNPASIGSKEKNQLLSWIETTHSDSLSDFESYDYDLETSYKNILKNAYEIIMKCIDKYIEVSEYDLGPFDNAYSNLNFLIKQNIRNTAYNDIYCKIREYFEKLMKEKYHFEMLKQGNGRFDVCAGKILEIQNSIFSIEDKENMEEEDIPYFEKVVYRRAFYKIEQSIEDFRCKIYWEKNKDKIELIPISEIMKVHNIQNFEAHTAEKS